MNGKDIIAMALVKALAGEHGIVVASSKKKESERESAKSFVNDMEDFVNAVKDSIKEDYSMLNRLTGCKTLIEAIAIDPRVFKHIDDDDKARLLNSVKVINQFIKETINYNIANLQDEAFSVENATQPEEDLNALSKEELIARLKEASSK